MTKMSAHGSSSVIETVNSPATSTRSSAATKLGNEGNNSMTGSSGPDVFVGLGGNDRFNGRGGNDLI